MIDLLEECQRLLDEAEHATSFIYTNRGRALTFENSTVLGFAIAYKNASELLEQWDGDINALVAEHQLALRRAQSKAWNTYSVLIAEGTTSYGESVALSAVEEDLTGTRKIARAGIRDVEDLRTALLPLLPIQNSPRLESVDMKSEIELRTTELPTRVIEAFLSGVQENLVAQVLEEEP